MQDELASTKESSERLRAVVIRSFSEEVRIVDVERQGAMQFLVSWRLGTDPGRPNKRSRVIQLKIELAAIEAYAAAPARQRHMADARLECHLQDRLMRLDPNHDIPCSRSPPLVRWSIGAGLLLG